MRRLGTAILAARRVAAATLVLTPACLKLNPGFDEPGATSGSEGMTGGPTGSTASGDPPTTGDTTTTAGTTVGTTSTGAGASTGEASTSMSSGAGETTTGGAASCWDLGLDTWTLAPIELLPVAGSPSLSPDALSVYYRGFTGAVWAVFRTARPSLDVPFDPNGIEFFHPGSSDVDYPDFVDATQELFFKGSSDDIYVTRHDGVNWDLPVVAGGVLAFGPKQESHSNLTADGSLLLFQRDDGDPFGDFTHGYHFYQLMRDPAVDAIFPNVEPTKVTPVDPGFGLLVCPTLSPDGLHLLFSGFDSAGGGFGDPNDGRGGVWYARRDAVSDTAWLDITRSEQLREVGWVACPVSVSADGCHLTVLFFKFEGGVAEYKLARRGA